MRKLADLEPRHLTLGERRIGVSFLCPTCSEHRVAVNVDPPFDAGPAGPHPWRRTGDTFESLTLEPSVVAYKYGSQGFVECWHGWVTAGVCS